MADELIDLEDRVAALSGALRAMARRAGVQRASARAAANSRVTMASRHGRELKALARALGVPYGWGEEHVQRMCTHALDLRRRLSEGSEPSLTWTDICDDLTEVWHMSPDMEGVSLHTFLGMTWEQYAEQGPRGWDAIPNGLRPYIYAQHKRWVRGGI